MAISIEQRKQQVAQAYSYIQKLAQTSLGCAGPQLTAVTSDSRGRLVYHNVSSYLSLTAMFAGRLAKGAQPAVLHDGRQLGRATPCQPGATHLH